MFLKEKIEIYATNAFKYSGNSLQNIASVILNFVHQDKKDPIVRMIPKMNLRRVSYVERVFCKEYRANAEFAKLTEV